jgi:mannose-6-phosphate isomerase-like protein (cupin superfamily)
LENTLQAFELSQLLERQQANGSLYQEFLRVDALNAGIYVLPAGTEDPQKPHDQDEVYYVVSGKATFACDGHDDVPAGAGSIIYVEAGVAHRFVDISGDLTILVLFAG